MANEKQILSERVAIELLEMITIEKRFKPGDKLPNENELSKEFGVSRTTLREAVRSLVVNNIIEIRRGKGTYVCDRNDLNDDLGLNKLENAFHNAKDIFEMRLIIEPQAAYLAAQRATDAELGKILKYGYMVEKKMQSKVDFVDEEQLFHTYIAKATHNEFILRVIPIIYKGIWSGIKGLKENAELQELSVKNRKLLLNFFENRNPDGAKAAMQLHIMLGMMKIGLEL